MVIAAEPPILSDSDELHDEVGHVRDLVLVRRFLREHGATATELEECDVVIGEARARLAEAAKRLSVSYAPAA